MSSVIQEDIKYIMNKIDKMSKTFNHRIGALQFEYESFIHAMKNEITTKLSHEFGEDNFYYIPFNEVNHYF